MGLTFNILRKFINIFTFKTSNNIIIGQIIFTCFSLALEFSITTIDFIFFEKISYKAAIGVGSLMAILYMSQNMVTLFAQAMVNNALYRSSKQTKDFNKIISAGFILSVGVSFLIAIGFFIAKDYLIMLFKIDTEAKRYALQYITYMIPFFLVYNIEQYLTYTLYALKLARLNFLYIACILLFNTLFNYIAVVVFHMETSGIAMSSTLSIIIILPLYFIFAARHKVKFTFKLKKEYFIKAFTGIKNLGAAAIAEPLLHQFVQFYMSILIAQIAQEMLSARYHANNFLTFSVTLALSFGLIIQMNTATLYGQNKLLETKQFYRKYKLLGLGVSLILVMLTIVFISTTMHLGWYTKNLKVQHYIIMCLLIGIIIEPMRMLSIVSKAYLKGLQKANMPLLLSLLTKILISLPLLYLVVKYTHLELVGILFIEAIGYFVNFTAYSYLIRRFYKTNYYNSIK